MLKVVTLSTVIITRYITKVNREVLPIILFDLALFNVGTF